MTRMSEGGFFSVLKMTRISEGEKKFQNETRIQDCEQ